MKLPNDLLKMYKEIHGWVGIIAGLCLFVAFYAGAVTMFEAPLERWASSPTTLAPPPPLARTPELIARVIAEHPKAAKAYTVHVVTDAAHSARLSWTEAKGRRRGGGERFYASFASDGSLQVEKRGAAPVAQFIDVLHQQVGLTFLPHEIAMPIMGGISLLYVIAIVSGLIVLLPSLVSDLFALRIGKNVKRMWLDVHNVLGLFSLPFHLIMALTAVVFAFHDEFYSTQQLAFGKPAAPIHAPVADGRPPVPLSPAAIVDRMRAQAPGFAVADLDYSQGRDGTPSLRVSGTDPRYGLRGPVSGFAGVDPATGTIKVRDYMPGQQDGWSATVTGFFTLHFGSFGGDTIRWAYFLLGLAGAFLFYTGNLLWIESRRKKERKAGMVEQTRATRILGALTVGVPLGCIAGISVTIAAAKLAGAAATPALHAQVYYAIFLAFTAYALWRGAARSGYELSAVAAVTMLSIPASTIFAGTGWHGALVLVDVTAIGIGLSLLISLRAARRRALSLPRDSVWFAKSASA